MAPKSYQAKAPGSLMLFGEHAVLHGSKAIVCAINKAIYATLTPRADTIIACDSDLLGAYECEVDAIEMPEKWRFVENAIKFYATKLNSGFDLVIKSDFNDKVGFGSSAAVTVAVVSVLEEWLNNKLPEPLELFKQAKAIMLKTQGVGSGADIAASSFKATIVYQMEPLQIEVVTEKLPPLTVVYSGYKTPTVEVIKKVTALRQNHEQLFYGIFNIMNLCVEKAITALKQQDWCELGELMNIHQGLQDAIGTNDATLAEIIYNLRQHPDIYGAKISGSGLGDCVVALGKLPIATCENQLTI